jgi:hypothetical protein
MAAPCLYVNKSIRRYCQTRVSPPAETVCEPDLRPLLGRTGMQDVKAGDQTLWEATLEMYQQVATGRLPL